jgi:hypothetical protein
MKNALKKSIILILLVTFNYFSYGQIEKPKYDFKMDEVSASFESELAKKKVDTIMQAFYLFDNGRGDKATNLYFWTKNGEHFVKAIRIAKKNGVKEFDIKECPEFNEILDFYFNNIKGIVNSVPKPSMGISHNYGYYIKLKINQTEFKTYLRNESRIENEHPRAEWINMIAGIAEPYIEIK